MRFLRGMIVLWTVCLLVVGVCCIAFGAVSSVDFDDPAVKAEVRLDIIGIRPATSTLDIGLKRAYLDDKDVVVREEYIGNVQIINQKDNPETPQDESTTSYTDLKTEIDALYNAVETKLKGE